MIAAIPMGSPRDGVEPTVLLVGAGERFTPAFQAALGRHRVFVETADLANLMDAVVVTAPDLVLLMGDVARDGGASVLDKLQGLSQNFSVPVVVLNDDAELDAKLTAFAYGAAAVLPRSASVDATAEQVARLARDIPERGSESQGELGEATLDEFVSVLAKRLRDGLARGLMPEGGDSEELRLVLGQGRPLVEFVDGFVRRVRRHVVRAEPLRYELDASEGAAAHVLPEFERVCVLLADDDAARADAVAQQLRARGVAVSVTDLQPSHARFQALRQADPTALVIGEGHAHGSGYALLRRMRRDARLRWASLLVVRWEDVWPDQRAPPAIHRLEPALLALAAPERALLTAAESGKPFETRLEATGPARCLRALSSSGRALRVSVEHPRVELSVDLSDGLVVGVEGRTLATEPKELAGVSALSALLVLGSGRVRIEAVERPASANVMAPPDVALSMADAETPPISPSIPATSAISLPPTLARTPDPTPGSVRPSPVVAIGVQPARPAPRPSPTSLKPTPVVAVSKSTAPVTSIMASPAPDPTPPPPIASNGSSPPVATTSSLPPPPTHSAPPAVYGFSPRAIPPAIGSRRSKPPPAPASLHVEANPPAMTVTPGQAASLHSLAPAEAPPRRHGPGFARSASSWLAKQDAKLHGKRIPRSTAAVLVGLGVLQGLLIVALYAGARGVMSRVSGERSAARTAQTAPTHAEKEAEPAPRAATSAVAAFTPPAAASAPSAHHTTAAAPTAGASAETAAADSTAPANARTSDGSNHAAPSCRELVSENPPKSGSDPVAALSEMRTARAAIVRGDLRAAQTAFCRGAELDPQKGEIALQLTHVLLLLRDGDQAAEWAERAVQQLPREKKAKETLGDALARIGAHAEAREAWFEGAGIHSANAAGHRALVMRGLRDADRSVRARDYVAAERYYRRAAVLDPKNVPAAAGLAYALSMLGDAGAAAGWARRAVEAAPRSAVAHFALGNALQKAGDEAGATAAFRAAVSIDPAHREAARRLRALDPVAK